MTDLSRDPIIDAINNGIRGGISNALKGVSRQRYGGRELIACRVSPFS